MSMQRLLLGAAIAAGVMATPARGEQEGIARSFLTAAFEGIDPAEAAKGYGLPGHLVPAMEEHLRELLSDQRYRAYMIDRIIERWPSAVSGSQQTGQEILHRLIVAINRDAATKGLPKMPPSEMRDLLVLTVALMEEMPAADCATLVREDASAIEEMRIEMAALSTMDGRFVRGYLLLNRLAMSTEYRGFLEAPLSIREQNQARALLEAALRMAVDGRDNRDSIIAAWLSPESATDEDACLSAALGLRAITRIENGDLALRHFTKSITDR